MNKKVLKLLLASSLMLVYPLCVSAQSNVADSISRNTNKETIAEDEEIEKIKKQIDSANEGIDEKPKFAVNRYIASNMRYPAYAQELGIEGCVMFTFIIEEDGSVNNVEIVKHAAPSLDKEALRLVNSMPKWLPAKKNGQNVKYMMLLPVNFKLK